MRAFGLKVQEAPASNSHELGGGSSHVNYPT
ncbi:MAG: hypothetical protein MRERV_2c051 [Mycoplasmataceae bacterium RV_VA103A]|nr:MAG: hypothetical protein MRERV_2c051 [Mycoplasmataceae bacterium RV_VA103A]